MNVKPLLDKQAYELLSVHKEEYNPYPELSQLWFQGFGVNEENTKLIISVFDKENRKLRLKEFELTTHNIDRLAVFTDRMVGKWLVSSNHVPNITNFWEEKVEPLIRRCNLLNL